MEKTVDNYNEKNATETQTNKSLVNIILLKVLRKVFIFLAPFSVKKSDYFLNI